MKCTGKGLLEKRYGVTHKVSDEEKKKSSLRMIGKKHALGHHYQPSDEVLKNHSLRMLGNKYSLGHKFNVSEETGRKIGQALLQRYRDGRMPLPKYSRGKRSYYWSPLQDKFVCFRSSWEEIYAKYLDKKNIKWLYEIKRFDLGDVTYVPDFYLPDLNEWHEVKGYMSFSNLMKLEKFSKLFPNEKLKIIDQSTIFGIKKEQSVDRLSEVWAENI